MTSPEDSGFDDDVVTLQIFQYIRDEADQQFDVLSVMLPDLADFARAQGRELAETICDSFDADLATDPAMPTLEAAYAKFVFAFTNPTDHADTLSPDKIAQSAIRIMDWSVASDDDMNGEPVLQAFAYYADTVAAHMLLLKNAMQDNGELADAGAYTADDLYDIVWARLEMVFLDETSEQT